MQANNEKPEHSVVHLVITGLTLGVVHVLSGPDHLSALAALSVGGSWRAFSLGIRWGIGHSLGLIIMTFAFLLCDVDLDKIGPYCEGVVGVFMIVLGSFMFQMRPNMDAIVPEEEEENAGVSDLIAPSSPAAVLPTTFEVKHCVDIGDRISYERSGKHDIGIVTALSKQKRQKDWYWVEFEESNERVKLRFSDDQHDAGLWWHCRDDGSRSPNHEGSDALNDDDEINLSDIVDLGTVLNSRTALSYCVHCTLLT
jgi:hypothetical protein